MISEILNHVKSLPSEENCMNMFCSIRWSLRVYSLKCKSMKFTIMVHLFKRNIAIVRIVARILVNSLEQFVIKLKFHEYNILYFV
ncbi:MAG: hypothetical protein FWH29_03310 [Methanobrevibacter sp.]|nr:hypothetical protein [Methanobrevibacter sp.]